MNLQFQNDILKFLCQNKQGKRYLKILDADLFDAREYEVIFTYLKSFSNKYKGLPNKGQILDILEIHLRRNKTNLTKEKLKEFRIVLTETIDSIFEPSTANVEYIKEKLIGKYQKKRIRQVFKENAGKLKGDDDDLINEIFKEISAIKKLGEEDLGEIEKNRGSFLLADHQPGDYSIPKAHPCYLQALNNMTSTKGFYSPQLIIIMAEPKGFKTGTVLNIAKNYMRDGYKVFYADTENGHKRISDRARQSMLNCTFEELISGKLDSKLASLVRKYRTMGGEFRPNFFPAQTKTIADVEAELDYLLEEYGWTPDLIVYDYLDNFEPIDYRIKEKRLKIQAVYFDAIRLNSRIDTFAWSPSQVSKGAVGTGKINMTDFAEDFGKAANCHAAFGIVSDEVEKEAGIRRILPVAQRDGVAQHSNKACFVKFDEARQQVIEIDYEEWAKLYQAAKLIVDERESKTRNKTKKRYPKSVTDD